MKVIIYTSIEANTNPSYRLILDFFILEGISVEEHYDLKTMMVLSRGHVNPASGFIVVINDDVCFDIYDVTKVIEQLGLRQI